MSRIRTIKPDFFKHEDLFDAEKAEGMPLRLAFAGLWTCCDREGRFEWRPRALKTDVLPYDDVDFAAILDAFQRHGFVIRYEVDGKTYGYVPSFTRHQVINNRESESKIPAPDASHDAPSDASPTRHGNYNGEREGEGEKEDTNPDGLGDFAADPAKAVFDAGVKILGASGVTERSARAFLGKLRKDHPGQDGQILTAIMDCGRAGAVDPIPWITASLSKKPTEKIFTFANLGAAQ